MFQKIFSHSLFHLAITAGAALAVLICIYPHWFSFGARGVNYAVQMMLLYLVAGIVFLFLRQPRLSFVFFGGCAVLAVFLKFSTRGDGIERWRQAIIRKKMANTPAAQTEPLIELKVAHLNINNAGNGNEAIAAIRASDADLLSVHEVTPDWGQLLEDSLQAVYPYHHTMIDIGIYGMAVFSKFPLQNLDTFYYQEIPNLTGCIEKEEGALCFISVHTEPALNTSSIRRLQEHLGLLASEIKKCDEPLTVLGDFNAVSWSSEMQAFLDTTGLLESRAGFMDRTPSFWDVPLDHIFYSHRLQCLGFRTLGAGNTRHIGICGNYQFSPVAYHAKKTAQ